MQFQTGNRVRHPKKEEWGIGEILETRSDNKVRVFFVEAGEKTLSLEYVQLILVEGDAAEHPVLDQLKTGQSSRKTNYQTLSQSIRIFLERFPQGFQDSEFASEERDYKIRAHVLASDLLGKETFAQLLDSENHAEICKRALTLANATNMIFPNEKMSLRDGLKTQESRKEFAESLFALLHGELPLEQRFTNFSKMLADIDAAKWTTATYFLFLMNPDRFMFVKPTITQCAAELCGFDLNYKPQLNWLTYKCVLDLSDYLFNALSELQPRDMIDVQSFMWCVAQTPATKQTS